MDGGACQVYDLPAPLWCVSSFDASRGNGLGRYDGFSGIFHRTLAVGLPYALGRYGLVGLPAFAALLLLPAMLPCVPASPRGWTTPHCGDSFVLAVTVLLYMCDNLLNVMFKPVYILIAGALLVFLDEPTCREGPRSERAFASGRNAVAAG